VSRPAGRHCRLHLELAAELALLRTALDDVVDCWLPSPAAAFYWIPSLAGPTSMGSGARQLAAPGCSVSLAARRSRPPNCLVLNPGRPCLDAACPPSCTPHVQFLPPLAGSGTAWLLPLVDGAPPIGWDMATRYLALPIALVIVQVRAGRRCADAMRHEYRQRGRQGLDCVRVARGARR
jgi:hypothetical protein